MTNTRFAPRTKNIFIGSRREPKSSTEVRAANQNLQLRFAPRTRFWAWKPTANQKSEIGSRREPQFTCRFVPRTKIHIQVRATNQIWLWKLTTNQNSHADSCDNPNFKPSKTPLTLLTASRPLQTPFRLLFDPFGPNFQCANHTKNLIPLRYYLDW